MSNFTEVIALAKQADLTSIEITYGINGYPKAIGDLGIIGFSSMSAAETFAAENGGDVARFESRDGWHFWNYKGRAYEPYSSDDMLEDLGDNYSFADNNNEFYAEQLKCIAADFDGDFADLEAAIERIKEIISAVDSKRDDEDVIIGYGSYYKTVGKKTMGYNYDTHRYAIGVFFAK